MKRLSRRAVLAGSAAGLACASIAGGTALRANAQSNSSTLVVAGADGRFTYNGKSPGPTLVVERGACLILS